MAEDDNGEVEYARMDWPLMTASVEDGDTAPTVQCHVAADGDMVEVLRITADGELEPGEGYTLSTALEAMEASGAFAGLVAYIRRKEQDWLAREVEEIGAAEG